MAIISHDGTIEQIPPGIFKSGCEMAVDWFPFDEQKCNLKFGSWTYDRSGIDLQFLNGEEFGGTTEYERSGEWTLIGMPAKRNVFSYQCCPDDEFVDLTYTLIIRRQKQYFMINFVVPCIMLAILNLLSFLIPPNAGEKISYGVTILLGITLFLVTVAGEVPPTSDAIPLITIYFSCVMLINALSVTSTILVLHIHHRSSETHIMGPWFRCVFCMWLPWLLRMNRPGHDFNKAVTRVNPNSDAITLNGDITALAAVSAAKPCPTGLLSTVTGKDDFNPLLNVMTPLQCGCGRGCGDAQGDSRGDTGSSRCVRSVRCELRAITKELQVITCKIKDDNRADEITSDWKFVGCVIDRLLLWIFVLCTSLITILCLVSAPNMFSPE